jgi:hypothetical protein
MHYTTLHYTPMLSMFISLWPCSDALTNLPAGDLRMNSMSLLTNGLLTNGLLTNGLLTNVSGVLAYELHVLTYLLAFVAYLRMSSMSSAVFERMAANSVMRMLQKKLNCVVSKSCTRSSFNTTWWSVVSGRWSVVSGRWSVGGGGVVVSRKNTMASHAPP